MLNVLTDLELHERSAQQVEERQGINEEHDDVSVGCDGRDSSDASGSGASDSGEAHVKCEAGDSSEGRKGEYINMVCGDNGGGGVSVSQFGEFVSKHHDYGNKKFRDNFEVQHSLTHTHMQKLCTCIN